MAHKHSVYDTDTHFIIDGVTRAVKNASQTKTMLVQHDHNSERFTFEIPRMVDGHDMSICNSVQVHYINIDSTDKTKKTSGVYEITDIQISPDSDDVVICSWLISGNATKYVGNLSFVVRFACVSDDGTLDYAWNTATHSAVSVSTGIYNGEAVVEEYVDVLEQWRQELFSADVVELEATVVRHTPQELTEEQKAQARANIGAVSKDYVDSATTIPKTEQNYEYPLSIKNSTLIYTGNLEYSLLPGAYATVMVTPGDTIQITGFQWETREFPVYGFYDSDGVTVGEYIGDGSNTGITLEAVVPENACKLIVNGRNDGGYGFTGIVVTGEYTQVKTIQEKTQELETSLEDVKSKTTATMTQENYEYPLTIVEGKLIVNAGVVQTFANGRYAETTVVAGDKIRITGWQWDSSYGYNLCYFYDENGGLISKYTPDVNGQEYTTELVVPDGAVMLRVNGSMFGGNIAVAGEFTTIVGLAQVVEELEALRNPDGETVKPKLITLGDSITALGTGERGWVKYFIEKTGCSLVANTAVNGAWLMDKPGTVYDGNPVFNGSDDNVNNVLGNQVQKIINNAYDVPDIILIAIGTNGGVSITMDDMKSVYWDSNWDLIPLENVDRKTSAGAYRYALEKLHALYPNAIIFWCCPIHAHEQIRTAKQICINAESLRIATDYTGQILIDTHHCGINGINEVNGANGQYLIDGLHPNVNGAKKIGYYNASKVMPFIGNNFELA